MAHLGFIRRKNSAFDRLSTRADATVNLAGGLSFEISDSSTRLLTMIGASLFDEPAFYSAEAEPTELNGGADDGARLAAAGALPFRVNSLSQRAQAILAAATDVAAGEHPRDLLAIAHWARKVMHIRTTPCILLAVAAAVPGSKRFVREYCRKIISRADELRQVFAAYIHMFGRPLPNSLKRGLADAFGEFDEFSLLRYNAAHHPTFADVLLMVDRGKNRPLPEPLFEFLVNDRIADPTATPIAAARKALALCCSLDKEARALAVCGRATWEVLVSQFGNRREVWEFMIEENLIPYMALLRNLHNILAAGVSHELIDCVGDRLEAGVLDSKQLPFRFLSAYRVIDGSRVGDPYGFDVYGHECEEHDADYEPSSADRLKQALETAMATASDALPRIPGTTLIAADNSGSMTMPISTNSFITAADAANLLCVMAARVCERALVCAFGTDVADVRLNRHDGVIANMRRVARADTRGCSTNAWRVFSRLREQFRYTDRVILLSDMQCWNSNFWNRERQLASEFVRYRNRVNPRVWLHSIDLASYGDSTVPADTPHVNLMSGFSEKILMQVVMAEGIGSVEAGTALPGIEYVRENF